MDKNIQFTIPAKDKLLTYIGNLYLHDALKN